MATRKIPQSSEHTHELHKVVVLAVYADWCDANADEADAQAVRAAIQHVLQRTERV